MRNSPAGPVHDALLQLLASGAAQISPRRIGHEVDGIIGEWFTEPNVDAAQVQARLAELGQHLSDSIMSGEKHLFIGQDLDAKVAERLTHMVAALVAAREAVLKAKIARVM